jgi:hypothetical protein
MWKELYVGEFWRQCCVRDEGLWPFGVVLRGRTSNRRMPHWLKTVVVSDTEKAPREGVR